MPADGLWIEWGTSEYPWPDLLNWRFQQVLYRASYDAYLGARLIDLAARGATGAGDCFDEGFLHAWFAGNSPAVCLRAANICGALSTEAYCGVVGLPDSARLNQLFKPPKCEELRTDALSEFADSRGSPTIGLAAVDDVSRWLRCYRVTPSLRRRVAKYTAPTNTHTNPATLACQRKLHQI